jgi:hypothetical protein
MGKNRDWLATWVDSQTKNRPLTPQARETALDIAEEAFHGNVGVGDAAATGVRAAEKIHGSSR